MSYVFLSQNNLFKLIVTEALKDKQGRRRRRVLRTSLAGKFFLTGLKWGRRGSETFGKAGEPDPVLGIYREGSGRYSFSPALEVRESIRH